MTNSLRRTSLLVLCALLGGLATASAQDDVVMRAMHDEMDRTMKQLQVENLGRPYFVSYQIRDVTTSRVAATLGDLTTSEDSQAR